MRRAKCVVCFFLMVKEQYRPFCEFAKDSCALLSKGLLKNKPLPSPPPLSPP